MPTNLEYRARERQRSENERVGDRPAKLNEKKSDRDLERKIKKQRRHFLLEEQQKHFVAAVRKLQMLAAIKVKMSNSEKKWTRIHTYGISSIKRVTRKFPELSRCSRAKQRQRNVFKKVCCTLKVRFLLPRPIVFSPFSLPLPDSFTRFYILFQQTINIIENFAFSPC